jgi:glycosyltransferase involved in cell wall biosynthesis
MLKAADRIIVSTLDYAAASDIGHFMGDSRLKDKFAEIPFGVDGEVFRPAPRDEELAGKYGISPEDKVILFTGGLDKAHYFKGMHILIKAFATIQDSRLLIVGRGNLRSHYEALARDAGISDSVIFAGKVGDEELAKHYNLADVFVLPSVDKSEAFGLVLLEAMACGKPVVASDLPGVRQVAADGGLTFKAGDADDLAEKMAYLLNNDDERKRLGEKGRRATEEKYDWKKVAEDLEKIYKL